MLLHVHIHSTTHRNLLRLEALVSALKDSICLGSRMEEMWALGQVKSVAGRSETSCLTSPSLNEKG